MLKVRALQVAVSVATIAISTGAFVDASFAAKAKSINVTGSYATADDYGHTNTAGGSVSANAAKSKSTGAGGKAKANSGGLYGGYAHNSDSTENGGEECGSIVGLQSISSGGSSTDSSRTAATFGASGSSASAKSGKKNK